MNFVTGSTGLVGSHLIYSLVKSGKKIRALKRASSSIENVKKVFQRNNDSSLFESIEWIEGDVMDIFSLLDGMKECDHVYHCAAVVSFAPRERKEMMRINIEGTANTINAALESGVKKFCHVSSIAALGRNSTREIVTEETHWKTSPENSYYSVSKYAAEREAWRGMEEGLDVIIVNPSVILGAGDTSKSSLQVFKVAQKGISHYTSGGTGFVDVHDVVKCMITLMDSDIKNERFILNSENLSFKSFFDMLHDGFNKKRPSKHAGTFLTGLAWRLEKVRRFITGGDPVITKETAQASQHKHEFSNEKIKSALHIEFIPVSESIKECVKYNFPSASLSEVMLESK